MLIEEAFPRLQESPQAPQADDPPDRAADSSMSRDTERLLWLLLVGDAAAREEPEETRR